MRRGNGSLYLTASLWCAAGISAVTGLLLAWAVPAAAPQDRVNAAYAAMGRRQVEDDQFESQLGAIRSWRIRILYPIH